MSLTVLELCKAVADIAELDNEQQDALHRLIIGKGSPAGKALLFDLMVKYDVDINHGFEYVLIHSDGKHVHVKYSGKDNLPRAILECIVEANG